jgi:hypothetical protein
MVEYKKGGVSIVKVVTHLTQIVLSPNGAGEPLFFIELY